MNNELEIIENNNKKFEDIKHIDEDGNEYWKARELMMLLEYSKWENFLKVINKAKKACENSGNAVEDNFPEVRKIVKTGVSTKEIIDYRLYRYSCYLIVQNADDIAKRKRLRYREDILDNMGSTELAANLFRITQTEEKLINDNVQSEGKANKTHFEMGRDIRKFIAKKGGTMPERLPKPEKSLKQLEKENKLKLNKK